MYRKLRDQAKRIGVSINTMRGLLRQGLPFSQVPTGSIYIADESIDAFFRSHEKKADPARKKAQGLASKVL